MTARYQPGLTLLEILLVLVLIAVAAATTMPSVKATLLNQRLKKGAESVRAEWTHARAKAIKTGQAQVFRFLVNGSSYVTMPHISPEDLIESDARTLAQSFGGNGYFAPSTATNLSQLPDGVVFLGADVAFDQKTASKMNSFQDLPAGGVGAAGNGQAGWGMPVFFFPDGTTSTARLLVANPYGTTLAVDLRGLTGTARVNPVANTAGSGVAP
jgi:prepilin-type N-terminal cleavage/methylation domain-containing protein